MQGLIRLKTYYFLKQFLAISRTRYTREEQMHLLNYFIGSGRQEQALRLGVYKPTWTLSSCKCRMLNDNEEDQMNLQACFRPTS